MPSTTVTVPLFAPDVNEMLSAIDSIEPKLAGTMSYSFAPTPVATTTAPDGAAATVWNVKAHEYVSYHGYSTSSIESEKFLESKNYFETTNEHDQKVRCWFKKLGDQATCIISDHNSHKNSSTTTIKKAEPFVTAYVVHHKSKSSSSRTRTTASPTSTSSTATDDSATVSDTVDTASSQSTASADQSASFDSNSNLQKQTSSARTSTKLPLLMIASTLFLSLALTLHNSV